MSHIRRLACLCSLQILTKRGHVQCHQSLRRLTSVKKFQNWAPKDTLLWGCSTVCQPKSSDFFFFFTKKSAKSIHVFSITKFKRRKASWHIMIRYVVLKHRYQSQQSTIVPPNMCMSERSGQAQVCARARGAASRLWTKGCWMEDLERSLDWGSS